MKRSLSLWLGLLAFVLAPAFGQSQTTTKIHGHVTNVSGASSKGGTILLLFVQKALGPGISDKSSVIFSYPVDANGDYSGNAEAGKYRLAYRSPGMTEGQIDFIDDVVILAGQDSLQDDDMTRKEFMDRLPEDERKRIEEARKKNADILKANETIKNINADAKTCAQDFKDVNTAEALAKASLDASASKSAIDAKVAEIKLAKFTEIESLMQKDANARPAEPSLWVQLGQAQVGLAKLQKDPKKYDEAESNLKKTLDVDAAASKHNPSVQCAAYTSLGELYARTNKLTDADAAFDSAIKIDTKIAAVNLLNIAGNFYNEHIADTNPDAQVTVAEAAIKADPTMALAYYLKASGLITKATVDPATGKMILPPGCAEAYQKVVELAPTSPFAGEAQAILAEATQVHTATYGTDKSKSKGKGK